MTPDMSYSMHDTPSMYNNTARMSLTSGNQFNSMDHFQMAPHHHGPQKFGDFSHGGNGEPMSGNAANQFVHASGSGSMFPHDRLFLAPCGPSSGQASNFPPLGFTPINRHNGMGHLLQSDQDRQVNHGSVKLEPKFCEMIEGSNAEEAKDPGFSGNGIWENQAQESDIVIADDLHPEPIEI